MVSSAFHVFLIEIILHTKYTEEKKYKTSFSKVLQQNERYEQQQQQK